MKKKLSCSAVLLFLAVAILNGPTNEVWIAIRTDSKPGTGTQKDPYDGSTMERFDAVMAAIPPWNLIHLGPGTFRTNIRHTWQVRTGWVVSGQGKYTTVQLGGNAHGLNAGYTCFSNYFWDSAADYVVIRDLVCDANWAEISLTADTGAGGEKNICTGAIGVGGSYDLFERIHSINTFGSWANAREQFAIAMLGAGAGGVGDVIQFCRVDHVKGNYGAPYALFNVSKSRVTHSFAQGINNGLNGGFPTGGVNLALAYDCEISFNTFIDCSAGYHDTAPVKRLKVIGNVVIRGGFGFIDNSVNDDTDFEIRLNYFEIQNRVVGGASYGIGNTQNRPAINWKIKDNTIVRSPAPGKGYAEIRGISLAGASQPGTKIISNIVDDTDTNYAQGAIRSGNRDSDGNVVPGLEDTVQPPAPERPQ